MRNGMSLRSYAAANLERLDPARGPAAVATIRDHEDTTYAPLIVCVYDAVGLWLRLWVQDRVRGRDPHVLQVWPMSLQGTGARDRVGCEYIPRTVGVRQLFQALHQTFGAWEWPEEDGPSLIPHKTDRHAHTLTGVCIPARP